MNRIQTSSEILHLLSNTTDEHTLKEAWQKAYILYTNNEFSGVDKKEFSKALKTTSKARIKAFIPLDFQFELAGQIKFKTNQIWLSARSQFFSELVRNSPNALHTFSIEPCDLEVFRVVKRFLKKGELEIPPSLMTEKVLEKALEWRLAALVTQVLEKTTITEENYQYFHGLAKKYRSMKLKCKVFDFVQSALCHDFLIKVYPFCLEEQDDAIQVLCEKYFVRHLNDYIHPDVTVLIQHPQVSLPILKNFRSTIEEGILSKLSLGQCFCLFQFVPSMITFSFAPYPEKEIRALVKSLPLLKAVMLEEKSLRSFVLFRNAWIRLVEDNQLWTKDNEERVVFLRDFAKILHDRFPFEKDLPFINVFINYLSNVTPDEKVLERLVDEELINEPTCIDFKLHILLNFHEFIETGDFAKILNLCRRSFQSKCEEYERLFRIPLKDLRMPICEILNLKGTPKEQIYNALRKCQHILSAALTLEKLLGYINHNNVWKKQLNKIFSRLSYFDISIQTRKVLLEGTVLTHLQKKLIYKALKNVAQVYTKTFFSILNCHQILMQDVRLNYDPIISSQEMIDMTGVPPKAFHPGFLKKHREIFENFIPRIQETKEVILQAAEEVGHYTSILKNMYSYLKFGDLKRLKTRLEKEGACFKRYETIFFEELNLFTKQLEWDHDLASKTTDYLAKRSNEGIRLFAIGNQRLNQFVEKVGALTHVLLDGLMQEAEEIKKDLVMTPTKRSRRSRRKNHPKVENSEKNEKEKEVENSLLNVPFIEKKLPETTKVVTLEERLQITRDNLKHHLVDLAKECHEMGFEESVINVHHHVEDLLSLIYRFFNQSTTLSPEQLVGFVIDCVRRGSLMTEQLLMGLRLKTNPVDSQEKLGEAYSHDLYSILIHCKFFAGPLSATMRKWIRETSRGDIFVRDIYKWDQNSSFVKGLLAKAKYFLQGNTEITPQEIIKDVFVYLMKIGELSEHLQKQIIAPDPKSKKYAHKGFHDFSELCLSFSQELSKRSVSIVSLSLNDSPLAPITQTLKELQSHSDNQYDFENVFQNFLPHLRAEMQPQNTLHPIYEHLHLGNVLLLNQMMAEEIFLALIDECQSPLVDWEEHDLFALVKHLGMRQTDFSKEELDFLNRGKATRQIVRYPASFKRSLSKDRKSNVSNILQVLHKAKMNSAKEKFSHLLDLEDGYQIGDKAQASVHKKTKALALKDVEILSIILNKVNKKLVNNHD